LSCVGYLNLLRSYFDITDNLAKRTNFKQEKHEQTKQKNYPVNIISNTIIMASRGRPVRMLREACGHTMDLLDEALFCYYYQNQLIDEFTFANACEELPAQFEEFNARVGGSRNENALQLERMLEVLSQVIDSCQAIAEIHVWGPPEEEMMFLDIALQKWYSGSRSAGGRSVRRTQTRGFRAKFNV
jgi:hypothetical protein